MTTLDTLSREDIEAALIELRPAALSAGIRHRRTHKAHLDRVITVLAEHLEGRNDG